MLASFFVLRSLAKFREKRPGNLEKKSGILSEFRYAQAYTIRCTRRPLPPQIFTHTPIALVLLVEQAIPSLSARYMASSHRIYGQPSNSPTRIQY